MSEASAADVETVETTRDLLDALELETVKYTEIRARLREREDQADRETRFSMGVMMQRFEGGFGQRFRMEVDDAEADYLVEVATGYIMQRPVEFSDEIARDFVERVAVMAAFPFLREAVVTMAARLALEVPLLGLLRAGQFTIDSASANSESNQPDRLN